MSPLVSVAMARRRSRTMTTLAATAAMTALALVISVTSSPVPKSGSTVVIDFENAFLSPVHNLTIQCDSDVATHPDLHFLRPQETFLLEANRVLEHRWVCTFSTEKTTGRLCGHEFSGKFAVWEHNYNQSETTPQLPRPEHPIRCFIRCKWVVNAGGLWLRERPDGLLYHIYNWPTHNC